MHPWAHLCLAILALAAWAGAISETEKRRVRLWIDSGATYPGNHSSAIND
jgi:hypothetical protein